MGRSYGIRLDADFRAVGVLEQAGSLGSCEDDTAPTRRSRLRLVSAEKLEAVWPAEGTETLRDMRNSEGRSVLTIDEHPRAGYRLDASYYGRFVVSGDGHHVLCAPNPIAEWEWQAFVVGQILPLLAVLQELEAIHGSAVAYGDRAIGLVAHSRGGKSSLAVNLARRGATFAADDVLALERDGTGVTLHPGPALASVRHAEAGAIGSEGLEQIGTVVGRNDHELRVAMSLESRPLDLAALYFIEHADQEPPLTIEKLERDSLLLLTSDYCGYIHTPERLVRQLDLYAHLSRSVPIFRAVVWPGIDAYSLAGLIHEHSLDAIASTA